MKRKILLCSMMMSLSLTASSVKKEVMTESKSFVRTALRSDFEQLKNLYIAVARSNEGLSRNEQEITSVYIAHILEASRKRGKIYIASYKGTIIGSMHCYRLEPHAFRHMLTDLTIVVHPDFQSAGIGRKLFTALLEDVQNNEPDIMRIELMVRESNTKARKFYESLGFIEEGTLEQRIQGKNGALEADKVMAWFNPRCRLMLASKL